VRVRGGTTEAKLEARRLFIQPLLQHLSEAGLGHISETADADPLHIPRGCPFQAWSVGELLRVEQLLSEPPMEKSSTRAARRLSGQLDEVIA
jgi:glycogen debranching enzyme